MENDKRVNFSNFEVNKEYFDVHCGTISKIKVIEINDIKFKYNCLDKSFTDENYIFETYLSDNGIVDCPDSYNNKLNALFFNKEDAKNYINDINYIKELKEHNDWCNRMDSYNEYDYDEYDYDYDDYDTIDNFFNED